MNSKKYIFSGPVAPIEFKECSLAQQIYNSWQLKDASSIAVVDVAENHEITYGDLLDCCFKLAHVLKEEFRVQKDDVVAIISSNTWKSIVVMISTLFCGGTSCFLNQNYSEHELLNAFKISKPKIIFATESVLNRITCIETESQINVEKVLLGNKETGNYVTFNELLDRTEAKYFAIEKYDSREKVCFILNSSGTTGLPKGVMLIEEGVRLAIMHLQHPSFKIVCENTIALGLLPLFHIFGILTTLSCITTGRKIVLLDKFDPVTYLKLFADYHITTTFMVPQILSFLAATPLVNVYDLSSLQNVMVGGSPLPQALEEKISRRLPNVRFQQVYGATEICGAAALIPYNCTKMGSVGKVTPNVHIKIVDNRSGLKLSYYETGEICVKSPGIMKGYKSNDKETKNSIRDGWWYTGDLGYFDEDGYMYIVGRIKELIKFKGFQVAPAQLEGIIHNHPAVRDVAVVGKPDQRAGELPTALVVKVDKIVVSESEIVQFVKGKISPESELHGGVLFVTEIPRNASGKIIRQKLTEMINNHQESKAIF